MPCLGNLHNVLPLRSRLLDHCKSSCKLPVSVWHLHGSHSIVLRPGMEIVPMEQSQTLLASV